MQQSVKPFGVRSWLGFFGPAMQAFILRVKDVNARAKLGHDDLEGI
jgi:hypothetical protein